MKSRLFLAVATAAFVAACGGGSGDAGPGGTPATPDAPRPTGSLLQTPPVRTDVDQKGTNTNDPFFKEKLNFAIVKAATAEQARLLGSDPDWEVAKNYHAAVFPFCATAAGKFFARF